MKKYSEQVVKDYLEGNDLIFYDIDELEADVNFMKDVISMSNDKNVYNLCSPELKTNYNFVRFVIEKFKNDVEFCEVVANNFFEREKEDEEEFTIGALLTKICFENKKDFDCPEANYFFDVDDFAIKSYIEKNNLGNSLGVGFIYFLNKYPANKLVLDYVAYKYLNQLLLDDDTIETEINRTFETYEDFERYGKDKFVYESILLIDESLAKYIKNNKDITFLNIFYKTVYSRWNIKREEVLNDKYKKCEEIVLQVNDLYEKYLSIIPADIDMWGALYIVADEYGVFEEIHNLDIRYLPNDVLEPDSVLYDENIVKFDQFEKLIKDKKPNKYLDKKMEEKNRVINDAFITETRKIFDRVFNQKENEKIKK